MSLRRVTLVWLLTAAIQLWSNTALAQAVTPTAPPPDSSAAQELQQVRLEAFQEIQQERLEAHKAIQQKDVDALRLQIAAVDKRVDDWNTHVGQGVDRLGVVATILGILVTVLLAGLGLLGYVSVIRRTKGEAQDAAKAWFDEKAASLEARLTDIESQALQIRKQMNVAAKDVDKHAKDVKRRNEAALVQPFTQMQKGMGSEARAASAPKNQAAVKMVAERAEELKKNPEDSYTFTDWNTRAYAAYESNQFKEAALFWLKASQIPDAEGVDVARVLVSRGFTQWKLGQSGAAIDTYDEVILRFGAASEVALREPVAMAMVNKGATQGQLGQSEAAIGTYDEVIRRFGESPEEALRELVARALVNKGAAQGQLSQSVAAIATYEEVIRHFGEAPELALREQVARAMVNKGMAQRQLGQSEAAIGTFDEVIRRFDEAPEVALREPVAMAMFNKGMAQRHLRQSEAAIATYHEVIRRFGEAPEVALRKLVGNAFYGMGVVRLCDGKARWGADDKLRAEALWREALHHFDSALSKLEPNRLSGVVLGNRAYALALLGDVQQAETVFATALRAPEDGGKALYDGTLADLEIHPIALDPPMRELVERQWRIWQAEQGNG